LLTEYPIDLDPTNNPLVSDRHIVLAWGRDYDDVSPLKGVVLGGGERHSMRASVDVVEATDEEGPVPGLS
jgi:transglutaminase-like putative cysteine protease